jgi:hypothetical protein
VLPRVIGLAAKTSCGCHLSSIVNRLNLMLVTVPHSPALPPAPATLPPCRQGVPQRPQVGALKGAIPTPAGAESVMNQHQGLTEYRWSVFRA